ncbi:NAD-dependent epimerase/dehydratase family protein (plasmid) [Paracoccus versutus]|uniref:UDP-glucuronate 4-epimerase n=1 Tax=Paracoccus versutus TaxID=34007 RepID=A0AAQ0HMG8_PARVE|nr:NAD-dependent epimerase/dehydratase family protein [Paracoccus versutus]REG55898.1 UDP-glucuronate 4-epimerase [Paracoccus versutus]WEJ81485.1 NAD-dependent epimerase/dehydratase family protein [Paracoccus versutus]
MRRALVTGCSGFIGFHLCRRLLADGFGVAGIDNLSDYYDPALKRQRQAILQADPTFSVVNDSIETPGLLERMFRDHRPEIVVHLAAQAGVRHSIDHPRAYLSSNIAGTFELLEAARAVPPRHMLLASTSSVYGPNDQMPWRETDPTDHPMSFYAATKKATEAMAHAYAHLYGLPVTMFRFFTVYGPWGRPDMALFRFTRAILRGEPIDVYNRGEMRRDFTHVDDLVAAIRALIDAPPPPEGKERDEGVSPVAPWRVVNIGNSHPVMLGELIAAVEQATGRYAIRNLLPMQPGDVPATWADTSALRRLTGLSPNTEIRKGVQDFVDWYLHYYHQNAAGMACRGKSTSDASPSENRKEQNLLADPLDINRKTFHRNPI